MEAHTESIQNLGFEVYVAAGIGGILCGLIGPFLVWRRLAILGNAVSHAAVAPISIALFFQLPISSILFPFSIILSLFLAKLEERGFGELDSILSVFFAGLMGLGILIMSQTGVGDEEIVHMLFGNIQHVTAMDFLSLLVLLVFASGYLFHFRRDLLLLILDRDLAATEGVRVKIHNYVLLGLCGLTVATCLKIMGVVLMTSLLIVPPLSAKALTQSLRVHFALSIGIALGLTIFGLALSSTLNLPSGATIAFLGLLCFLVFSFTRTEK